MNWFVLIHITMLYLQEKYYDRYTNALPNTNL